MLFDDELQCAIPTYFFHFQCFVITHSVKNMYTIVFQHHPYKANLGQITFLMHCAMGVRCSFPLCAPGISNVCYYVYTNRTAVTVLNQAGQYIPTKINFLTIHIFIIGLELINNVHSIPVL